MEATRKITRLEVCNGLALRLTFDDGSTRVFNLAPLVTKGGVYAPLTKAEYFNSVKVAADGRYVEWPNGLDLCADALWLDGVPA